MAKLNFSKLNHYKSSKLIKKVEAICKMISKGAIPPKSFGKLNPDAIPTASQIDIIYRGVKHFLRISRNSFFKDYSKGCFRRWHLNHY